MKFQIVLCYPALTQHLARIQRVVPEAVIVDAGQERIGQALREADVYCGHAKVPVAWEQVVRQGRLRWIQSSAAGTDHCLHPSVVSSEILVTSASGLFASQVGEHTLALLLGLLRGLPVFFRAQQQRVFRRQPTRDLRGLTVGIVGLGGNGRHLSRLLHSFGVRLIATDVFPERKPVWVEQLWPAERLDDLMAQADIVILCVPLTPDTQGLIDARRLARMRPSALLINVARGPVVVEKDLVAALERGQIAGAGLDVTETEPLPADSPLWRLPNVMITPHVAAQSADRLDRTTELFCHNLARFTHGLPLDNLVDKALGFPRPSGRCSPSQLEFV